MCDYICKNCETTHDSFEGAIECCACEMCAELEAQSDVLFRFAFICGYEAGHNDTVESCYADSAEAAIDALNEVKKDGSFYAALAQPNEIAAAMGETN